MTHSMVTARVTARLPLPRFGLAILLLVACGLPSRAFAQTSRSVVLLQDSGSVADDAARLEREKALRLELQARDITLLGAVSPEAPAAGTAEPVAKPLAELAAGMLESTGAAAVLWLEGDPARAVSWLFVRRKGSDELGKAPLPHPPQAIGAQLFALAAASLLDQVLREPAVVPAPAVVVPAPAAVAAVAPVAPVAPVATPVRPAPPRPPPAQVPPAPRSPEHRYFAQLGFALPIAMVSSGMEASSRPPADRTFIELESIDAQGEPETRYYFDNDQVYVPDADSFDDYETLGGFRGTTPVSTACEADGTETAAGEAPSKYCVRVDDAGFVFVPALRLAVGVWLAPDVALALIYQWHLTVVPETFFGAQSLALEGQYVLLGEHTVGFSLGLLAQLGVGRTETPAAKRPGSDTVNALSGPIEAAAGVLTRYALSERMSLVASLSISERFPEPQLGAGLALAAEHAF